MIQTAARVTKMYVWAKTFAPARIIVPRRMDAPAATLVVGVTFVKRVTDVLWVTGEVNVIHVLRLIGSPEEKDSPRDGL